MVAFFAAFSPAADGLDAREMGLISVIGTWAAGAYILTRYRETNAMSISRHASSTGRSYWLFAVTLTVAAALTGGYLFGWIAPHLELGTMFRTLAGLTIVTVLATAWTPEIPGFLHRAHRVAAYTMALLFMPLVGLMAGSPFLGPSARWVCLICLAYMIVSFSVIILAPRSRRHFLVFQASYIVAFQLALLAVGYLTA